MFDVEISLEAGPRSPVSPLIFGGLIEHLGRSIYGGVWDDEAGAARADVTAAIRALGVTMLRWPGGCFSSWYHWRDGVGPPGGRPTHERTYWTDMSALMGPEVAAAMGPPETNRFGTDEFLRYCADTSCEPLLVANLGGGNPAGTGTPDEAAAWVRHCNVDRRSPTPVRWWAVGNETWGAHELGHCSAADYAVRFNRFAGAMRHEDPAVRLVAAGVTPDQYGLGATGLWDGWNLTLLGEAGPSIDALSLHWYFPGMIGRPLRDDEGDYLQVATGADDLERILTGIGAEIDLALPHRRLPVALDEWGQMAAFEDHLGVSHRLSDAVFFAGCYNAMLRHADRLSMAMIAGLVNVLAPIQTVGVRHHVTSAYLVGYLYRRLTRTESVPVQVDGPMLDVAPMADLDAALMMSSDARVSRRSPAVDVSATTDADATTVFVANRSIDQSARVIVGGLADATEAVWHTVTGPHLFARNDAAHPDVLGLGRRPIAVDRVPLVLEVPPATTGALSTNRGI